MLVLGRFASNRLISKSLNVHVSSANLQFRAHKSVSSDDRKNVLVNELSSALGCNVFTAQSVFRRVARYFDLEIDDFRETLAFCKAHIHLRDVIENPGIMTLTSKVLSERLICLMELGLRNIQAAHIINFNYIMAQTPDQLKQLKTLRLPTDESQIDFEHIGFSDSLELQSVMRSKILSSYSKNCTLATIKADLNAQFLAWKLKCSQEVIEKFMKRHSSLKSVSIKGIESSIDVLIQDYGLDPSKITYSLFILSSSDRKLRSLFINIHSILGIDIQVITKKLPMIAGRNVDSLRKVEEVLLEFHVVPDQLMSCPKVLMMDPATLRHRLKGLHESEDFRLLKNNKDFLWLVIHHKWLNHRLKFLKSTGVSCSISVFLLSPQNFKKRMKLSKGSTYGKDVVRYFADIFQCSESSVRNHICDFPNMSSTSILNAVKVIDFLLSRGVSKEQLWNCLGIVAYELDTVEKYFDNLPYYKEFQPFSEWKGHFNLIHLLIYAIERNSSCTINMIPKDEIHDAESVEREHIVTDDASEYYDTREFGSSMPDELMDSDRNSWVSDEEYYDIDEELSDASVL